MLSIILCPGWTPTAANLASLQRELLNHHRREGCSLVLENGRERAIEAGQQIGQVVRAIKEMTRLTNSALADELWQLNLEHLEDVAVEWENHYRRVDNVAGKVSWRRRLQVAVASFQGNYFGSVARPATE